MICQIKKLFLKTSLDQNNQKYTIIMLKLPRHVLYWLFIYQLLNLSFGNLIL